MRHPDEGTWGVLDADGNWQVVGEVPDVGIAPYPERWWTITNTVTGLTVEHDPATGVDCSQPELFAAWLDAEGVTFPAERDAFDVACQFMEAQSPPASVNMTRGNVPDRA